MTTARGLGDLLLEIAQPHSRAWHEGYAAYSLGRRHNPFVDPTAREDWFRGFNHAKAVGAAAVASLDDEG